MPHSPFDALRIELSLMHPSFGCLPGSSQHLLLLEVKERTKENGLGTAYLPVAMLEGVDLPLCSPVQEGRVATRIVLYHASMQVRHRLCLQT